MFSRDWSIHFYVTTRTISTFLLSVCYLHSVCGVQWRESQEGSNRQFRKSFDCLSRVSNSCLYTGGMSDTNRSGGCCSVGGCVRSWSYRVTVFFFLKDPAPTEIPPFPLPTAFPI